MTIEAETQIDGSDSLQEPPTRSRVRARAKSSLPPLPRLRLKSGEVLGSSEGMGVIDLSNRRLLAVSLPEGNQDVLYGDIEVLKLAGRSPFAFEEREERAAHQIIVPRAGRVMTDAPILEDCPFTWNNVTRCGRWIPRDGDITRNVVAMARRMQEVREKLGDREIAILVWYAPRGLRIFANEIDTPYFRFHMGCGVQFSVEGMQAEEVQKVLDPWWDGGMGCGGDFTYLDMRGYKVRWEFSKA